VNHQSFIQIKEIRPSAFTLGTISKKRWKHPRWLVLPRILLGSAIGKLATDMPLLLAQHPAYIYIHISSELGNSHPATTLIDDQLQNSLDSQVGEQLQF
jgi:hypothetical protein